MGHHKLCELGIGVLGDVEPDKLRGEGEENGDPDHEHCDGKIILCPYRSSYARRVLRARKLRGEDSDTGKAAEYAEVEYEEELVYRCNRRHLDLAYASDHYVVDEADGVGEGVLDYDRNENCNYALIKRAVADEGVLGF